MHSKRFEYHTKDIPFLKKDCIFRFVFTALFFAIFVWQFVCMVSKYISGDMNTLMVILAVITLVLALFMAVMSFIYGYKSIMIISDIKKKGKAVRDVAIIGSAKSKSFLRMYGVFSRVMAVAMAMLFISGLTYIILEIIYYSSVSFYIPMLLWLVISGFNSTYHIDNEIKTVAQVQEFVRAY